MESLLHDLDWVLPLRSAWATDVAVTFSFLGYARFFLVFLPLAYWLWDRDGATRLVALVTLTAIANSWLKDFWQDPRPDPKYALDPKVRDSFGRPSGHAQVGGAMWFGLAREIARPWIWVVAVVLVAGIAGSRLYLGVHDVDDVLVGLVLGIACVLAFAPMAGAVDALRRLPIGAQFLPAVGLVALAVVTWPLERGPGPALAILFLFGGWATGTALDHRLAPEAPARPAHWKQAIAAVGGIAGLVALSQALEAGAGALHLDRTVASSASAVLLGFYMTGVAPIGFRWLGLAGSPRPRSGSDDLPESQKSG